MSTQRSSRPALRLYVTPLGSSSVVVKARGHIDASNSVELDIGVRTAIAHHSDLLIDLTGLEFIGNEGVSALLALHESLTPHIRMVVVPSPALTRLLRLYSHTSALVIESEMSTALAAAQGPGPHLVDDAL
ncbi:hypothetical protein BH09ACT8_BH09ACT8_56950 [soil metagenome]